MRSQGYLQEATIIKENHFESLFVVTQIDVAKGGIN